MRSDMTARCVHLTKPAMLDGQECNKVEVLFQILKQRTIRASGPNDTFLHGKRPAVCFQDTPLHSIAQNIWHEQDYRKRLGIKKIRYTATGLSFSKRYLYLRGGRPVIYDKPEIAKTYLPDENEWWRIVRYDLSNEADIVDWTHEREWRIPEDFEFEPKEALVLLPNPAAYQEFLGLCRGFKEVDLIAEVQGVTLLDSLLF